MTKQFSLTHSKYTYDNTLFLTTILYTKISKLLKSFKMRLILIKKKFSKFKWKSWYKVTNF